MTFRPGEYAGWHVIIGDNGSGKSALVRAIALLFTGPDEAMALRQRWEDWIRDGISHGKITVHIDNDRRFDEMSEREPESSVRDIPIVLYLRRNKRGGASLAHTRQGKPGTDPGKYLWGNGSGWFRRRLRSVPSFHGRFPGLRSIVPLPPEAGSASLCFRRGCRTDRMS